MFNTSFDVHLRGSREGEEVTHRYSWAIERNDRALVNYFFVHERQPPLLCTLDLPGVSVWDDLEAPPADHELYGRGGPLCIQVGSPAPLGSPTPAHLPTLPALSPNRAAHSHLIKRVLRVKIVHLGLAFQEAVCSKLVSTSLPDLHHAFAHCACCTVAGFQLDAHSSWVGAIRFTFIVTSSAWKAMSAMVCCRRRRRG